MLLLFLFMKDATQRSGIKCREYNLLVFVGTNAARLLKTNICTRYLDISYCYGLSSFFLLSRPFEKSINGF